MGLTKKRHYDSYTLAFKVKVGFYFVISILLYGAGGQVLPWIEAIPNFTLKALTPQYDLHHGNLGLMII